MLIIPGTIRRTNKLLKKVNRKMTKAKRVALPKPFAQRTGAKVGWEYYLTETDARANLPRITKEARRKGREGYDFGYCCPGTIERREMPDKGWSSEIWFPQATATAEKPKVLYEVCVS
jgi:bifunctional DNA-binding transcriptional regulator/antitoxin component of YhaV-PrlF toxin-antitoxin module